VSDDERLRWARTLATAGWMFLLAYLGVVTALVRRATAIKTGSFEDGLWWQRVEVVSSSATPQNLIIVVPAAAASAAGAIIVRSLSDRPDVALRQLIRAVAGTSYMAGAIAVVGIVGVFFRNPDAVGDVGAVLGRVGGTLMATGMIAVCLEAERSG
jgi:hypothetical protein